MTPLTGDEPRCPSCGALLEWHSAADLEACEGWARGVEHRRRYHLPPAPPPPPPPPSPAERARELVTVLLHEGPGSVHAFTLAHEDPHPPAVTLALAKFAAQLIGAQAKDRGMEPVELWQQAIAYASRPHTHDDGT